MKTTTIILLCATLLCQGARLRGIRLGPPSVPSVDITTGLLGWYKFDEGSGTNVADSSGNGYNGAFFVATAPNDTFPAWTTAKIGSSALIFTRYQGIKTTNFADSLSNYTIACWYKIGPDSIPGQLQMVNKFADGVGISGAGWVLMNESGDITMAWGGASCGSEGGGDTHTDTNWNHVAACVTGTNIVQWNNGALVSQVLILTCSYANFTNTGSVRIGWNGTSGDSAFVGSLDDVRIYNRALISNEVQAVYNYR